MVLPSVANLGVFYTGLKYVMKPKNTQKINQNNPHTKVICNEKLQLLVRLPS